MLGSLMLNVYYVITLYQYLADNNRIKYLKHYIRADKEEKYIEIFNQSLLSNEQLDSGLLEETIIFL